MNRYTYSLIAEIDLDFLPSVKERTDFINETMAGFGFTEKMSLRSTTEIAQVSANRLLTEPEKAQLLVAAQACYNETPLLKGKFDIKELKLIT